MRKLYSPLRYPGGKAKILDFMKELIETNHFSENTVYVEPYAGGAAVALGLLIEGYVSEIYVNDFDPAIYSFWKFCIKKNHKKFIEKIRKTKITIKEWYTQSKIYNRSKEGFNLGFATFFLNRCNHSGIMKGGVIGGLEQTGKYKIDCRFNKEDLISRIETISKYKDKIQVYHEDTKNFLCRTDMQKILQNCLLYLDPPYYKKGKQLYKNFYTHKDHQDIANIMRNLNGKWVVSYDNRTEIQNLYSGFKKKEFNLTYCAGPIAKGAEVMFFSNELNFIPELQNAA
ncbi:DNA-methyltransferase [Candidatus Termititenax persephonae]|uniref:site-specific DNA-methyltransferase (adenine-specific) n=1 Tax=Candidatus Termititenax persephonae TaxID=2218525 RepID=A0A388THM9_9BACT|nr:DNA-methyltransferase [Candidatus Termititenax persephonae]